MKENAKSGRRVVPISNLPEDSSDLPHLAPTQTLAIAPEHRPLNIGQGRQIPLLRAHKQKNSIFLFR